MNEGVSSKTALDKMEIASSNAPDLANIRT